MRTVPHFQTNLCIGQLRWVFFCCQINWWNVILYDIVWSNDTQLHPWLCHQSETFSTGIHWSTVNSPERGQWRKALIFFYLCLNQQLSKQYIHQWFEMPSCTLWHLCNVYLLKLWRKHVYSLFIWYPNTGFFFASDFQILLALKLNALP